MKLIFAGILAGLLATTAAKAEDMVFTSWGGTTQEAQNQILGRTVRSRIRHQGAAGRPDRLRQAQGHGRCRQRQLGRGRRRDAISPSRRPRTACSSRSTSRSCRRPSSIRASSPTMPSAASTIPSCSPATRAPSPANPKTWADLFDTEEIPGQAHLLQMVGARRHRDRVARRRRAGRQALSARSRPRLQEARHHQVRHHLVERRRAVAAAARFRRGAVRPVLERPRLRACRRTAPMSASSWDQNLTAADVLVVPKGAKNKEAAMKFLAAATSAGRPGRTSPTATGYAPINLKAKADDGRTDAVKTLPDSSRRARSMLDMDYWAEQPRCDRRALVRLAGEVSADNS